MPGSVLADPAQAPLIGQPPSGCAGDPSCIAVLSPYYLQTYLGCTYARCPDTYRAASPVFKVTDGAPPTFLATAQIDLVPASQAYEMANALNEAGVRSVLQLVPGIGHADGYRSAALGNTIAFFAEQLDAGASARVTPRSPPTTAAGSAALPALEDGWAIPAPPPGGGAAPLPAWLWTAAVVAAAALAVALVLVVRRDVTARR
ncbi:MAG: prolyl oligopeptidase family serine peptidase [Acidimicrobiales bacterium]